jgi:hypothetical protein
VLGLVARADVLRWLMQGWGAGATLADVVGENELLLGYADELVGQLADRMAVAGVGRVPIIDRGTRRLAGIVSRKDLLVVRASMVRQERERQSTFRLRPPNRHVLGKNGVKARLPEEK